MSLGVGPDEAERRRRVQAGLRAMAHPIRLRILSLLTGAAMTAAEVARELNLTHANASYHLRQLAEVGQIQPVAGQERIRGGIAKRYRYVIEDKPAGGGAGDPTQRPYRRALYDAVASELRRRAAHLAATPNRSHMTDADLWVDPADWATVREQIQAASDLLHKAAKPSRTPGTIRINASIVLFEMEPDA